MKNLTDIMKQVQSMQSRMGEMQEKLADMTVTAESGAGLVSVTMTGRSQVTQVSIDERLMRPEDREIVEDLVVTAFNAAKAKAEAMVAEEMKQVTGGMPLPPGFKMPF
jgi:nucleoid-associated protein EbfC